MSGILTPQSGIFTFKGGFYMKKALKKMTDLSGSIEDGLEEYARDNEVELVANVFVSSKKVRMPDAIILFQSFARLAAIKLNGNSNRMLNYLFSKSAYENFIAIDVKTMCEEMNMNERTAYRSLKELEECNIVIRTPSPSDRRRNDYFINPSAAWRGSSSNRVKAINKLKQKKIQMDMFGNEPEQFLGYDGSVTE